jgi:hypothetical protein
MTAGRLPKILQYPKYHVIVFSIAQSHDDLLMLSTWDDARFPKKLGNCEVASRQEGHEARIRQSPSRSTADA